MSTPLKIAVAGIGTVGGGVLKLLAQNRGIVAARAGRAITVTAVSARTRAKQRGLPVGDAIWFDDPVVMAREADADVIVELMGGEGDPALGLTETALGLGRSVVTANKALLAHHGNALALLADETGAALKFEAAVAGGIPIINALKVGLAANKLSRISGILNGTCNYILTKMEETGRGFDEILAEAQAAGYAEADPSFDVDGIDAAHKLALLAALGFGMRVRFEAVTVEGIREIEAGDIAYARELGYRIKLLGVALRTDRGIETRVQPSLVSLDISLAHVDGVFNAVMVEGDAVGRVMFEGRGAGEMPTASAVVADIIDIARGNKGPAFLTPASQLVDKPILPSDEHQGAYYLRLRVTDRPGVIAAIATELAEERISIDSMVQRARGTPDPVPIVLVTHETDEAAMRRALGRIRARDFVSGTPCLMRIEKL